MSLPHLRITYLLLFCCLGWLVDVSMLACEDRFYLMNVSVVDTMEVETIGILSSFLARRRQCARALSTLPSPVEPFRLHTSRATPFKVVTAKWFADQSRSR
jgi:hypothetical protein